MGTVLTDFITSAKANKLSVVNKERGLQLGNVSTRAHLLVKPSGRRVWRLESK
jgi:hypothetical protein